MRCGSCGKLKRVDLDGSELGRWSLDTSCLHQRTRCISGAITWIGWITSWNQVEDKMQLLLIIIPTRVEYTSKSTLRSSAPKKQCSAMLLAGNQCSPIGGATALLPQHFQKWIQMGNNFSREMEDTATRPHVVVAAWQHGNGLPVMPTRESSFPSTPCLATFFCWAPSCILLAYASWTVSDLFCCDPTTVSWPGVPICIRRYPWLPKHRKEIAKDIKAIIRTVTCRNSSAGKPRNLDVCVGFQYNSWQPHIWHDGDPMDANWPLMIILAVLDFGT